MTSVVTPAQLLLAIAEHETLERTCAALGLDREAALRLLRGAVIALRQEPAPVRPAQRELPSPSPTAAPRAQAVTKEKQVTKEKSAGTGDKAAGDGMLLVYSDGASRGNPGPAGAGAVITDARGTPLARLGRFLGRQTNNVAEYQGLLLGLRHAQELGAKAIAVSADSQLMIRQLQGRYAVKHAGLKPLHAEALRLLRAFDRVKLEHIPREENTLADEMSNRAIDEEM